MLDWFFDHKWAVSLLLGSAAVALFFLAKRSGNRRAQAGAGGAAASLVFFLVVGFFWETAAQQITRKTKEMAAALNAKDVTTAMQHVSEDFSLADTNTSKELLRSIATGAVKRPDGALQVDVRNFKTVVFARPAHGEKPTADVEFNVKVPDMELPMRCKATFVRDADGQWRLKTFQLFPVNSADPMPLPSVPSF